MKLRGIIALALALLCAPALAQVNPGTSPLSGGKGGTGNAFMQFSGPATSLKTYTLPNASDTLAALGQIQTWAGAQSFGDGKLVLLGATSGSSTLKAPATGGGIATLFPGSDTIAGIAASQALTNKIFNCASNTCTVRISSDVSGLGTGVATALGLATNASGGIITPTPTRAGDVVYWNGSAWATLAGNNSGTQFLQETAAGVPSWATVAGTGTVTTITAGYGVSLSSGATCTTTCTDSVSLTTASNVLGADVLLNNTALFFDGPSMAQGATGTWFVSGTVTVQAAASTDGYYVKLWDGTSLIDSTAIFSATSGSIATAALSGIITSPAGNIRISVRDISSTTGKILFNTTGLSKDSSISGFRIQ